jgi:hypothetical protein
MVGWGFWVGPACWSQTRFRKLRDCCNEWAVVIDHVAWTLLHYPPPPPPPFLPSPPSLRLQTTTRLVNSPAVVTDHESASLRRMMRMLNQVCLWRLPLPAFSTVLLTHGRARKAGACIADLIPSCPLTPPVPH